MYDLGILFVSIQTALLVAYAVCRGLSVRVSKSGEPSEPGSENNLLLRILGFFFKNEMLSDYKKTMPF